MWEISLCGSYLQLSELLQVGGRALHSHRCICFAQGAAELQPSMGRPAKACLRGLPSSSSQHCSSNISCHLKKAHACPRQVEVTHAVAMFFVGEARKNGRQPANQEEVDDMMIYNYPPAFTGRHHFPGEETDFEQSYIFDRDARIKST